jgi:hypothetical protein
MEARMATLSDRIDHFVRWFFNSSPDKTSIEPRPIPQVAARKSPAAERSHVATKQRNGKERRPTAPSRAKKVAA